MTAGFNASISRRSPAGVKVFGWKKTSPRKAPFLCVIATRKLAASWQKHFFQISE
jgi:hypothetical protein